MATWPDLAMLKQALGVTVDARDDLLELALGAAIEQVKIDVDGSVAAFDDAETGFGDPTSSLAAAALLLAVTASKAPDAPFGVAAVFDTGGLYVARNNPNYRRLLKGHRRAFGIGGVDEEEAEA